MDSNMNIDFSKYDDEIMKICRLTGFERQLVESTVILAMNINNQTNGHYEKWVHMLIDFLGQEQIRKVIFEGKIK